MIAVGKEMLATTARDLKSHHLRIVGQLLVWFGQVARGYTLDVSIFSGRHSKIFGCPDDALDSSLMGQAVGVFQKIWRGIGPVDVKNPGPLLLAAGKEMRGG